MNIRDIAAAAHVSVATVSKVINHKDSEISDETRQKVLRIIKEYQYTPYANLKTSFNTGKSQLIAVIVQEGLYISNYIFQIEKEASHLGYSLLICTLTHPHSDSLRKYMKILEARKAEAILLCVSSPELLEEAVSLNYSHIPLALIASFTSTLCTVFHLDYKAVAEKAVSELVHLGHQKIGCILNGTDSICSGQCIQGYKNALLPLSQYGNDYYIATHIQSRHKLQEEIQQFMRANVTAIFCQTFLLANAVYEILKEGKYYIPSNVSVICTESSASSSYLIPPLTSCIFDTDRIIQSALEYLVSCIESRNPPYIKTFTFEPLLLSGESIAPPASVGKQILVVGNCNTDINIHLPKMPGEGEILKTSNISIIPGGKAVAQAVGAGKLKGSVYILGCIGNDTEGNSILNSLKAAHVHVEGLTILSSLPTGRAYIFIPDGGNSSIISYPGANSAYINAHIKPFKHLFQSSDYCLLSTEINSDLIDYIIRTCERFRTKVFVKPSSIHSFPEDLFSKIAYFIPSSYELDCLVPGGMSFEEKADQLYQKGCQNIIVTLGGNGCYLKNEQYSLHIPSANFNVVDTTGAANCFIAALAVSLSKGSPLLYAISYATYAAGISVTHPGVQTSFPDTQQLELYLDEIQDLYRSLS